MDWPYSICSPILSALLVIVSDKLLLIITNSVIVGQEIVQMVKVSESKLLIIGRPRIGMLFNLQSGQPELLPNGGLNGEINAVVRVDNLIYIGGQFTATADQTLQLPNNIAILSVNSTNSTLQWLPFPVSEVYAQLYY